MKEATDKESEKKNPVSWGLIAGMVIFLGAVICVVIMVMSGDDPRKKSTITTVTLLKPPPPPQIKEKLPEPEIKQAKKEEIIDQPKDEPKSAEKDNTPAGDKLGLDAEGKAGGDAFGLAGRKGGRSLLAGGDGLGGLSRFAGYNRIVEAEVRKAVMKVLDENGGIPKGKLQSIVKVKVDSRGNIVDYKIIGSSGNNKMDEAVKKSLAIIRISEPPPDGKPATLSIKVVSQG